MSALQRKPASGYKLALPNPPPLKDLPRGTGAENRNILRGNEKSGTGGAWGGPRCPALPVAEEAGHKCVPRSADEEGVHADEDAGHRKRTI